MPSPKEQKNERDPLPPTPPLDSTEALSCPPKRSLRRPLCWGLGALILLLPVVFFGVLLLRPKPLLNKVLHLLITEGNPSLGGARWKQFGVLELSRLRTGEQFVAEAVELTFSTDALWHADWQQIISHATLVRPILTIPWQKQEIENSRSETAQGRASQRVQAAWQGLRLPEIEVIEGRIQLTELGPGIPPLNAPFSGHLQGGTPDEAGRQLLRLRVQDVALYSPFDLLARLLSVETVDLSFTLIGLLHQRMESLELIRPTLYVGPDLFWFAEYVKKQTAADPTSKTPWTIGMFELRGGRLCLAAQGQPELTLPLLLSAQQKEMAITALQDLHLQSHIQIPPLTQEFPAYKLAVENLRGSIDFSLPKEKTDANNIVNQLACDGLRWRQFAASALWLSVTFDAKGLYLSGGGDSYGGYLKTDLTVFFNDMSWVGSMSATGMQLDPLTRTLTPDQVTISGPASGTLVAKGRGKEVLSTQLRFRFLEKGRMEIRSLDQLRENLPATWTPLRHDMVNILVDAFRSYDYTRGEASLDYEPPTSTLKLDLDGLQGQRRFTVRYHHTLKP